MFTRALPKDNQASQPSLKSALSNSVIAPAPKIQPSIDDAIRSQPSPPFAWRPNALSPSQTTFLNGTNTHKPVTAVQSTSRVESSLFWGRSVGRRDRLVKALNSQSSFQENPPPPMVEEDIEPPPTGMDALRGAVYFEEDYSDDDLAGIDSELLNRMLADPTASITARAPSPPRSTQRVTPPTPPKQSSSPKQPSEQTDAVSKPPSSSAPFYWSSSPPEHHAPPIRPAKRREPPPHTISEEPVEYVPISPKDEIRSLKKRSLPWDKGERPQQQQKAIASKNSAPRGALKQGKDAKDFLHMSSADLRNLQKEQRMKSSVQKRSFSVAASPKDAAVSRKKNARPATVFLSEEQRHVLDLVAGDSAKSIFFTGSAGTGKSVLLREVIASLRKKFIREDGRVAVTASTGLAACNIGGVTLHSFAGIGLGKEPVPDLIRKIKKNAKARNRWLRTKVLIIDEISMVDGELFDKLEAIARQLRNSGRPFGGIQLVITGDFFQLPPVPESGKLAKFAFEADSWNTSVEHTIGLTQVFRQKDPIFASMLNEMRLGFLSPETIANFKILKRVINYEDGLEATELFPTRQEVDAANNLRLRQINGESMRFEADDTGTITDPKFREKLLSSCMAPPAIDLKVNSQVMLIKNMDDTLVNGSLGRVIGFMDEKTFDLLHDDADEFDSALSMTDEKTKAALSKAQKVSTARRWPLVQFSIPDGTSRQLLVQPEQWKVELPSGEVQACRTQVPLILAWALSIHKAQGQTLERVKVDLGKVFEKGQAYVALSRATCQEGLQVLNFDAKKVMAHEKVRGFYNSLSSAQDALKSSSARSMSVSTAASSIRTKSTANSSFDFNDPDFQDDYDEMEQGTG